MNDKPSDNTRLHADDLRQAIDSGHTGDKVAAPDPAAVPLGTDDETAGQAPSHDQVQRALERERRDLEPGSAKGGARTWITLIVAGLVLLALLLVLANWLG